MNVPFINFTAYKAIKGGKDKTISIRLDLIAAIEPKTDMNHEEIGTVIYVVGGTVLGVKEKVSQVKLKMGVIG
jgi:hypothetical protein